MLYEIVFMGLIGLAVGSFLNVVADRVPAGKSLLSPPSHCASCGKRLRALDLAPVVSYVLLGGKCRYCKAAIGPRSALVEAATAGLFALATWRWGFSDAFLPMLVFIATLVTVFVTDLEQRIIPNTVVLVAAVALLAFSPWNPLLTWSGVMGSVAQALLGALTGFAVMVVIFLASRGGMGVGDIKLAGVMGLALGPALVGTALFISFLGGGAFAGVLLLARRRGRKDLMPFGTFMGMAGVIAAFVGPALYRWYFALLGAGR